MIDLDVFVPVISRCENGFTKPTRIAGNSREVDAFKVILNVLFPVIHFSAQVAFKPVDTAPLLQKSLYMQLQLLSAPCKSEQFKWDQFIFIEQFFPKMNPLFEGLACGFASCAHEVCSVI